MRAARLLLPDETSRLLRLDRGALAIELDEKERSGTRLGRYRIARRVSHKPVVSGGFNSALLGSLVVS